MMKKHPKIIIPLLLFAILLTACKSEPTPDIAATSTAIAGTAFAMALTTVPQAAAEAAGQAANTPPPFQAEPAEAQAPTPPPAAAGQLPNFSWTTQVVDQGGVGNYPSLALDQNDNPHIAYLDDENDNMKYATVKDGAWALQSFDSPNADGLTPAIALDGAGNPTVCRLVASQDIIACAYLKDNTWNVMPFISNVNPMDIALDLDVNAEPHVVFYDNFAADIKYARFVNGSWQLQSLDTADKWAETYPFVLGPGDQPHLSYSSMDYGLKYTTFVEGNWYSQKVDTGGIFISLALDTNGIPHLAYHDSGEKQLKYATIGPDGWQVEVVDNSEDVGKYSSIAVDAQGYVHISYYDQTNASLKYAVGTGGQWQTTFIEQSQPEGNLGMHTSLALTSSGYPVVAYFDKGNASLKYAVAQPQ